MGTSSARKAPVGKYWRTAKTSIARFASGKEASPPQVKEVVARYLAALTSGSPDEREREGDFLPGVIQAAASLGTFYHQWKHDGWEAALESLNIPPAVGQIRLDLVPALLDTIIGPGNTLVAAVTRAALIDHLQSVLPEAEKFPPAPPSAGSEAHLSNFLGQVLYRTLLSDLGESLEFHATTIPQGNERQEEIRHYMLNTITALMPPEETSASFASDQVNAVINRILTLLDGRHER